MNNDIKKDFKLFVNETVSLWRNKGLNIPNKIKGMNAEKYIIRKIKQIKSPSFFPILSQGSFSPADIYSLANRKKFFHIMLIQVKSSKQLNKINGLKDNDITRINLLASFLKTRIELSQYASFLKNKPIIISTGYIGVLTNKKENRNYFKKSIIYRIEPVNTKLTKNIEKLIYKSHMLK